MYIFYLAKGIDTHILVTGSMPGKPCRVRTCQMRGKAVTVVQRKTPRIILECPPIHVQGTFCDKIYEIAGYVPRFPHIAYEYIRENHNHENQENHRKPLNLTTFEHLNPTELHIQKKRMRSTPSEVSQDP